MSLFLELLALGLLLLTALRYGFWPALVGSVILFSSLSSWAADDVGQSCTGKFPNLVDDVCWSCMYPLRIAGGTFVSMGQEDTNFDASNSPVCTCSNPPRIGVPVAFWEPVRMIEVVRKPMCFPTLNATSIPDPLGAPRGLRKSDEEPANAFYHVHWYTAPLMQILQVLLDYDICLERGSLDVAYMTELDPMWNDAELTQILNPDVYLFANPIAQAACAADCVAASAGFPLSELFWCAGCQGSMYPLTGQIPHAAGGVPSSALIMQRFTAKLHRELLVWGTYGQQGVCSIFPQPLMDKRAYKFNMVSPSSTTKDKNGRCCQPFGRAHQWWGLGKEVPAGQQDFSYLIFRKRNCCFSLGTLGQ
jgi:conjugal transfer pilus assembly protein TraU